MSYQVCYIVLHRNIGVFGKMSLKWYLLYVISIMVYWYYIYDRFEVIYRT